MQVVAMETETETGEMIVKRVSVPIGLEELMEGLTKEVLLKKPDDIYSFAAEYFSQLLLLREKGGYKVKPARSAQSISKQIPKKSPEKLLVRGASKQLSRQLSVRGESPVKKDVPTRRFPTRRAQTEDRNVDRNKFLDRRNKFRKAEPDTKNADTKPKYTSGTTPRAPLDTSDDKQNTLNERDRSVSTSRRGRSVTKNVQATPRQRSTTTPRRAQNSSESNKTQKSPRSSQVNKSQKDDSHKSSTTENKDKVAVPKVSSVEEIQEFVKDGKLTVAPPKIIKRPQAQGSQELVSSLPVPQLMDQSLPTEKNIKKNEMKEKSILVADEEDKKEDPSGSVENRVVELKKGAVSDDTQKEQVNKSQTISRIASTEKDNDVSDNENKVEENTTVATESHEKEEGENLIRYIDENKKKEVVLTNNKDIDVAQKDQIELGIKDSVEGSDYSENIASTDNMLVERGNLIFGDEKSIDDNSTTITSEFSESDNKSIANDKVNDKTIDSTISENSTIPLDKTNSQKILADGDNRLNSSEIDNMHISGKNLKEGDSSTENTTSVNTTKSLEKKVSQNILADDDKKINSSENDDKYQSGKDSNEDDYSTENSSSANTTKSLDTKDSEILISNEKINLAESDATKNSGNDLILIQETKQEVIDVEKANIKAPDNKDQNSEKLAKNRDKSKNDIEEHVGSSELEEKSVSATVKSLETVPPENVINETEKIDIDKKKDGGEEINKEGKSDTNVDNKILQQIKAEAVLKTDSKYSVAAAKGKDLEKTESESNKTSMEIEEPKLITPQDTENSGSSSTTEHEKEAKQIETEGKDIKPAQRGTKETFSDGDATKEEAKSIQGETEIRIDKERKDFRKDPSKIKVIQDAENDYLKQENMADDKKIESAKQEIENKAIMELTKNDLNNIKPLKDNLDGTTSKPIIEDDKNAEIDLERKGEEDGQNEDEKFREVLRQKVEKEEEKSKSMKDIPNNLDDENADKKIDAKENILKSVEENRDQPISATVEAKVTDPSDKELNIKTLGQVGVKDNVQHSENNKEHLKKTDTIADMSEANEINKENENINTEIVSSEHQPLKDNVAIINEKTINTENLGGKNTSEKEDIKHTEENVLSKEPKINDIEHGDASPDLENVKQDKEDHANIDSQLLKSESTVSNTSLPVDVANNETKTKQIDEVSKSTENNISEKDMSNDLEKHKVQSNLSTENVLNPTQINKENNEINTQEDTVLNIDESKLINVNGAEDAKDKQNQIGAKDNDTMRKCDSKVSEVDKTGRENDAEHKSLEDSNNSDTVSDKSLSDAQHTYTITDNTIEPDSNERNLEACGSPDHSDVIKNVINSVITVVKEGPVDQVVKKYIDDFIHNEKENVFILKPDQDRGMLNKDTNDKQGQQGDKAEEILVKTEANLNESTNKSFNSDNTKDKELTTKNSDMRNVINSTLLVSKTGTVDAIVKNHINDFLHNEKEHVFRETNELNSHGMMTDQNLVTANENKVDDMRISVTETAIKAKVNTKEEIQLQEDGNKTDKKGTSGTKTEINTKQDSQPQNLKQGIANKISRTVSQTLIQVADSDLKQQNSKTRGERKLRRVKTVDVIKDESKPKAEIKSRIPTADYRHRVKRDIDSGKHSIRIKQKPSANEAAKILPGTINTLAKDDDSQNDNKDKEEGLNTTSLKKEEKKIIEDKKQNQSKDLGLPEKSTPEQSDKEIKDTIDAKLKQTEIIPQIDTEIIDENKANKLEDVIVDKTQPETKFDTSKLREELKTVENESKLSTFKPTFNPYILRQEIKNASQYSHDNDDISKNSLTNVLTPLTAALKIQSLWRGFKVRRDKLRENPKRESPAAESQIEAKESLPLKSDAVLKKSNVNIEYIKEGEGKFAESPVAESIGEGKIKDSDNGDTPKSKEMVNEVVKETTLTSSSSESRKFVEAALVIQKIWRGFIVRKRFKKSVEESKLTSQNSKFPQKDVEFPASSMPESEYSKAINENFVNAAITIQKIWRGFKIRKSSKENKKVKKGGDDINNTDKSKPEDHGIVEDFSKLEIKEPNEEIEPDSLENNFPENDMKLKNAAITIQRIWRGFHIRKIRSNTQKKPQVTDSLFSPPEVKEESKKATLAAKEEAIIKSSVKELKTELPPLFSNTDSKFVDAAILIQKMWRGFKVRKFVNGRKENDDQQSNKLQKKADVAEGNKETVDDTIKQLHTHLEKQPSVENEKFIKAAIKIQKIWRGFKVRKTIKMGNLFGTTVEAEKPITESIEAVKNTDPKDKKSALKIQSLWRGYQVRKNINIIKNKLDDKITANDEGQGKELNDGDILNAATKIQAGVRGYLQRKRCKRDTNNLNSITEEETNERDNRKNPYLNKENEGKGEKVNDNNETTNLEIRKMSEDEVLKALEDLNKVVIPTDSPIKGTNKPSLHRRNTVQEPDMMKKKDAPLFKSTSLNPIIGLQDANKDTQATDIIKDRNNNSSEKYRQLTPLEIETKEAIENITEERLLLDNTSTELNDENKSDSLNIINDKKSNKPLSGQQSNTDSNNTTETVVTAENILNKSMVDTEQIGSKEKIVQMQSDNLSTLPVETNQISQNTEEKPKEINLERVAEASNMSSTVTLNIERDQKSDAKPLPSNDIKDNTNENKDFIVEKPLTQESNIFDNKEDNKLNDDLEKSETTQPQHTDSLPNVDNEINDEKPKYERPISIDSTDSAITVIYNELEEQEDNDENRGKISDDLPKPVSKKDIVAKVPLMEHEQLINDLQNKLLDQISGKNGDTSADNVNAKFDIELLRKELADAALLYNPQDSHLMHQNSKEEINDHLLDYLTYKSYEKKETDHSLLNTSINMPSRDLPDITEEDSEAKSMEDSDLTDDVFENSSNLQTEYVIEETASVKENISSSEIDIEKIQSTLKECEKLAQEINIDIHHFETIQDTNVAKSKAERMEGDDSTENKRKENCRNQSDSFFCKIPNGTQSQPKYIDNKPLVDHVEYIDKIEGTNNTTEDKLINGKEYIRKVDSIPTDLSASKDAETNSSSSNKLLHTGELHDSVIVPLLLSSQDSQASQGVENMSTKSSSEDVAQTSPRMDSKLLHTGELHDSVIVPLPLIVQNSLKSEQEKYGCNTGIPENQLQQSSSVNASSVSSAADVVIATQQLEPSKDIVSTNKGLLHTGELHDTIVVPLSLEAQHYPSEETFLIQKEYDSSQTDSEVLKVGSDLTDQRQTNNPSDLSSKLNSPHGDLHDTVVVPLSLDGQHPSEEKCLSQEASNSPQTESKVLFMTDLTEEKQANASSELSSKPKSPPKAVGLVHTGELHDTVVIPGTITEDVEDEAAAEQKGKVLRQVDSECQTSSGANVLPIEVHLNEVPAGVAALTSPRPVRGVPDVTGVEDDIAQAPDKGALPLEFSPDFSSPPDLQSMESEKRKNATINNKSMEVEAATKIQAGFRGYQVRKQLKLKNGSSDINNQKRQSRRKSSGRITDTGRISQNKPKDTNDVEEKSAVKIQAGVRGFLVRRRQKKQKNQES